jgi:single-strand DNA-binding protein
MRGQGFNQVVLVGCLGRAPEMRYTPGGRPVTSFSIVTTRAWVSPAGVRHEETDWFNVVVWGSLAEACKESLAKGQQVFVAGRMKTRRWQDAEEVRHSCAEVVAQNVVPLPGDLPEEEPALSSAQANASSEL